MSSENLVADVKRGQAKEMLEFQKESRSWKAVP